MNGHLDYMKRMDGILKAVGLKTRPPLQEQGGLLATPSAPSEEEEEEEKKQGISPDSGTASEEPDGPPGPDAGGPEEGAGLKAKVDHWCWEPVSAPGQECEVSPAKDQTPETLPSSSSSSSPS